MKRYFDIKDKVSIPQKIYYEKNRYKLLPKESDHRSKRNTKFNGLHRSYVELQKKLKALEEKVKLIDSEIN